MKDGRILAEGPPRRIVDAALVADAYGLECAVVPDPVSGRTRLTTTSLFHTTEERDGMLPSGLEGGLNKPHWPAAQGAVGGGRETAMFWWYLGSEGGTLAPPCRSRKSAGIPETGPFAAKRPETNSSLRSAGQLSASGGR
jgi:hypothetical protein